MIDSVPWPRTLIESGKLRFMRANSCFAARIAAVVSRSAAAARIILVCHHAIVGLPLTLASRRSSIVRMMTPAPSSVVAPWSSPS